MGILFACCIRDLTWICFMVLDPVQILSIWENSYSMDIRMNNRWTRRDFLKVGTGAVATCLLPAPLRAAIPIDDASSRSLSFYNTHTNERLTIRYFKDSEYATSALNRINRILRDHRTGEIRPIDTQLLDMLYAVKRKLSCKCSFHIISGYRSAKTNEMLRKNTSGVAKKSYHTLGRAIDIRIPGCNTRYLKKICMGLQAGGVGYYPGSDFVHMDNGRVRTWGA